MLYLLLYSGGSYKYAHRAQFGRLYSSIDVLRLRSATVGYHMDYGWRYYR